MQVKSRAAYYEFPDKGLTVQINSGTRDEFPTTEAASAYTVRKLKPFIIIISFLFSGGFQAPGAGQFRATRRRPDTRHFRFGIRKNGCHGSVLPGSTTSRLLLRRLHNKTVATGERMVQQLQVLVLC